MGCPNTFSESRDACELGLTSNQLPKSSNLGTFWTPLILKINEPIKLRFKILVLMEFLFIISFGLDIIVVHFRELLSQRVLLPLLLLRRDELHLVVKTLGNVLVHHWRLRSDRLI